MARNWETFKGRGKFNGTSLRVSLNRKLQFSFNHPVYSALGEPASVVLMYDSNSRTIGMRPAQSLERHAYPVRKQPHSKSYVVGAIAFTRHYKIETQGTVAFDPFMEDGALILEIDKAVKTPPRKRPENPNWNGGRPRKSSALISSSPSG